MQQLAVLILTGLAIGGLVFWVLTSNTQPSDDDVGLPPAESSSQQSTSDSTSVTEAESVASSAAPKPLFETDREIVVGALGPGKYFNSGRIAMLGLPEQDLTQVRYWADLQLDYLMSGGPPPDGIPPIDNPRYVSPAEADAWLPNEALVVGVSLNGVTRAYPIAILNWHEIVNDVFGNTTVVVTYCPLCNSSIAFLAPQIEGETATFGTSGRLYLSDLVMYDRVTGTFWSQLEGAPIVGPMVGVIESLKRTPIDVVPYGFWKEDHPDTLVLDRPKGGTGPDGTMRDYTRDPYARYRVTNPELGATTQFGIPINDDRLQAKDSIVGIYFNGQAKAYPHTGVLSQQLINDWVGETPVVLAASQREQIRIFNRTVPGSDVVIEFASVDDQGLTDSEGARWDFNGLALDGAHQGAQLEELVGTIAFWFSWITFNPDTEFFETEN